MKQYFLIFASMFFFSFIPQEQASIKLPGETNSPGHQLQNAGFALSKYDDIYVSFDYLTDVTGYKYGAVFYLYNPTDYTVSIQWQFVGYSNLNFSPTNSDRTTIPGKTKIWISNVTSADQSKAWSSGKVQWKY